MNLVRVEGRNRMDNILQFDSEPSETLRSRIDFRKDRCVVRNGGKTISESIRSTDIRRGIKVNSCLYEST